MAVLVSVTLLTGCAGQSSDTGRARPADQSTAGVPSVSQTSGSATASVAPDESLLVTTRGSDYGTVLFDGRGQAIYLFDKEQSDRAECYGDCAVAWPPVLTEGAPRTDGAVRAHLLGSTTRDDGSSQVTYAGHPLYYYAHEGPRQILCHNVNEFGGLWLVVTPRGAPAA
jgi:predicted lipoprotein with Yx(FWY)xxD motif